MRCVGGKGRRAMAGGCSMALLHGCNLKFAFNLDTCTRAGVRASASDVRTTDQALSPGPYLMKDKKLMFWIVDCS